MNNKLVNALKVLFTPLALAFLFYVAWVSRAELVDLFRTASSSHLIAAVLLWGVMHALSPLVATMIFRECGSTVSWRQALTIHAARLPARYLPGGIWHTVGRVMDYREQGIAARHISVFVALENGLAAAVTLTIGGAIVFCTRGPDDVGVIAAIGSVIGVVGVLMLLPLVNKKILQGEDRFSVAAFAKSTLLVLLFWGGAATAFLLYINAFPAATGDYSNIELAGIYLFSWGVGFVAIFAPQGIGVFELVASELAASPIGLIGFAALIAGFRVIVLLADIAFWLIYTIVNRKA